MSASVGGAVFTSGGAKVVSVRDSVMSTDASVRRGLALGDVLLLLLERERELVGAFLVSRAREEEQVAAGRVGADGSLDRRETWRIDRARRQPRALVGLIAGEIGAHLEVRQVGESQQSPEGVVRPVAEL